ncbi:c-type cytochrome [Chachezhania sediminis]|uniref:c-type cytochrome n=1 Tax=Chachezhania sediminis TaxID=2599291 RepID=UPI00131D450B|nr:cytochrome c [Chachezhania sediminis]
MKSLILPAVTAATLGLSFQPALADEAGEAAMAARHGEMSLMAHALGILGGMAKGQVEYEKIKAEAAAETLYVVSSIDQHLLWPEGSEAGALDGSRAKAEIWTNMDDFTAKWNSLHTATEAMKTAAGESQQAIGAAMGAVGGACSACHKAYRTPAS